MLSAFLSASAEDFIVDSICYNITYKSGMVDGSECAVTYKSDNEYRYYDNRFVNIPEQVSYNGYNYKVTGITWCAFDETDRATIVIPSSVKEISEHAFGNSFHSEGCTVYFLCDIDVDYFILKFENNYYFINNAPKKSNCYNMVELNSEEQEYSGAKPEVSYRNYLKQNEGIDVSLDFSSIEKDAGTYTTQIHAKASNGIQWDIPFTYTIKKKALNAVVANGERMYGDENPKFRYASVDGFVDNEGVSNLDNPIRLSTEATPQSGVGTYPIVATLEDKNYTLNSTNGKLTVVKAPLSVSVKNCTKVYGDPNPSFSLSYAGLKNGETAPNMRQAFKISTEASAKSPCGTYPISISGGVSDNYEISSYTSGELAITKRDLTCKVGDYERLYGKDNPEFKVSYAGFANGDDESSLTAKPKAECNATKESNVGDYAIYVDGGKSDNYNFVYTDGKLTVNPLVIGFKDEYQTVTYDDMSISSSENCFSIVPEIFGPYNEKDFWLSLYYLDKDDKYPELQMFKVSGNEYAGGYINTNETEMNAGKYAYVLEPKEGGNPNIVANPSKAFITVNRASTNLEWDKGTPIVVEVGEKIDLGINYQANMFCDISTEYNSEIIELSSDSKKSMQPHWYAKGLKEGETTLYFGIKCRKNDKGFYDFKDSKILSKRIMVVASTGIDGIKTDKMSVSGAQGRITVSGKADEEICRVYTTDGVLWTETKQPVVENVPGGIYVVKVGAKSFKVTVR